MFHRDGIVGALTDGHGEQVDSYVTMKLLDDPDQNVDKILDEFFSRYYGASAKPMKQLYLQMEETFMNSKNYPDEVNTANKHFHQTEEIAWGHLGTTERMTKWAGLMKRAKSMARTDVEKKRVSMFDDGVWSPMWAAHIKHERRVAEKPKMEALRAQEPPTVRVPLVEAGADGDVSKVDWTKGALLGDWHTIDGYSTDRQASGRILHDGAYLYLQFTEAVPDSSKLSGGVYNEDHLELFFGWQRAKPYRQAGIAPSGDFHSHTIGEGDGTWKSGAKIVSDRAANDRWTVSMSFPMNAFLAGGVFSGSTFYGNIIRGTAGDDNLSWSPLFGNGFHVPERMGRMILD
jgi:hypothetical protein